MKNVLTPGGEQTDGRTNEILTFSENPKWGLLLVDWSKVKYRNFKFGSPPPLELEKAYKIAKTKSFKKDSTEALF